MRLLNLRDKIKNELEELEADPFEILELAEQVIDFANVKFRQTVMAQYSGKATKVIPRYEVEFEEVQG